ncbi:hypothetical protein MMC30_003769 [Trapelia coarctata]|nr:hypothetical protein [Trapelia coarctata]
MPTLRVVRIPADGSPPHLIERNTTIVWFDNTYDCYLCHVPNFLKQLGNKNGRKLRVLACAEARDMFKPELDGNYYVFKSVGLKNPPLRKHAGFCGVEFIVKTAPQKYDRDTFPAYENVPESFLGSDLHHHLQRWLLECPGDRTGLIYKFSERQPWKGKSPRGCYEYDWDD